MVEDNMKYIVLIILIVLTFACGRVRNGATGPTGPNGTPGATGVGQPGTNGTDGVNPTGTVYNFTVDNQCLSIEGKGMKRDDDKIKVYNATNCSGAVLFSTDDIIYLAGNKLAFVAQSAVNVSVLTVTVVQY